MRRKKEVKEVEEVEEVKSFHLPASVRLYLAHTPDAARHGAPSKLVRFFN